MVALFTFNMVNAQWVTISERSYALNSIYFPSSNIGFAVGTDSNYSGGIIKTTDGGNTWITQFPGTSWQLNSVYFTDTNTGYVVGNSGTILKTINGGINWINQYSGADFNLHSVYFTDANTGYVVGGGIYGGVYGTV